MAAYAQYNGCGYPSANQVSYVIINQVLCYCHVYVYVTLLKYQTNILLSKIKR